MKIPGKHIIKSTTVILCLLVFSCSKDKNIGDAQEVPGTISLEVHAMHHSWDVSGIMFYLKKNATDFPGKDSSIYEFKGQADGYGKYTFEKLYPGNYYVYASGFDAIWGANVIGYAPIILDASTVTNNYSSTTLLVSE